VNASGQTNQTNASVTEAQPKQPVQDGSAGANSTKLRVSVVTVCFNSAGTIEGTIRSVREQEYGHVEHVVVDGGSTDGTQEIVARYNGRIRKFISEPDDGIYDAMNKGLRLAEGEIVGFLNADDVYAGPSVISEIAAAFEGGPADAVYGDLIYVRQRDTRQVVRYWRAGKYGPKAFHSGWVPPHPTFFCRMALYRELGGFDPAYRIAGDFELMLRFIEKHGIRMRYIPKPLVHMRAGGRGNTLRGIFQGNRELIRAFHRNGMPFPARFFGARLARRIWQFARRPAVESVP